MLKDITHLHVNPEDKLIYTPLFFRVNNDRDKEALNELLFKGNVLYVHDGIYEQLQELIKCQNPSVRINQNDYNGLIERYLKGVPISDYGVWVYYPWSRRLVHLLDEEEFIKVRTNRNQLKITGQEQQLLREKKIGIVGLSVGQSIALTIVMERICGEIRLADFDTAELSNLNRLRTGLHNMGINKTIIAAREIMEIDPFMKVRLFNDGLHQQNMDEFFTGNGKLDLFIEVCDGIDIKIESRFKAKALQIPVVMDTNDRGMLDVERFDKEKDRSILHGLIDAFIENNAVQINDENRRQILMSIVSFDSLSEKMKLSMTEINKTINTWPQLASSVVLGGAITTDIARRILLDQHTQSGRYYVDLDDIIKE
jgi:molybdopterin/thiamine biosynthesis adenylyltransferase